MDDQAKVDIRDVPFGGGGRGECGPRNQTVVSLVNGTAHFNLYNSDAECEDMRKWPLGVNIRVQDKDGKPAVLHLSQAVGHQGHTLRKKGKSGQHEHIAVPTETIGQVTGTLKRSIVKSWREGDTICIDISGFYK
jgi:hypothetical protein